MLTLYIGNKNYSSWSLRPWLLVKHFDITCSKKIVDVAGRGPSDMHRAYFGNGLVPCLHLNDFQVWDTLAIAEFLAERYPDKTLWPKDPLSRARARSISAEMHSGFGHLRGNMGMNVKLELEGRPISPEVQSDINRIEAIWNQARTDFAPITGGDYLFGEFSIADAMFAPVVWRFNSYNVQLNGPAQEYMQTMLAHPNMQEWRLDALAEKTAIAHYDDNAKKLHGESRT